MHIPTMNSAAAPHSPSARIIAVRDLHARAVASPVPLSATVWRYLGGIIADVHAAALRCSDVPTTAMADLCRWAGDVEQRRVRAGGV